MTNPTPCPNCGRDSFLDLMCADCTRAFEKGLNYAYKDAEKVRASERLRIVKKIMFHFKYGNQYILNEKEMAELEKGEA